MSVFVFSVLCYLTPLVALLSMQPVFVAQFLLDLYYTPSSCGRRRGYKNLGSAEHKLANVTSGRTGIELRAYQRMRLFLGDILDNKLVKVTAFLLQVIGTGGIILTVVLNHKPDVDHRIPVIALPLSVATLAVLWSNKFQEFLLVPEKSSEPAACGEDSIPASNARYKAS